jgi:predicted flap endonuclease-1-like 5' DNA nuclease
LSSTIVAISYICLLKLKRVHVVCSDAKTKPAAAAASSSATQPHTDNNKTTTASSAKPAANEKSELTSLSGLPPLGMLSLVLSDLPE